MGLMDDITQKVSEFKAEQRRRADFKRELDFKKYQAVEIERAKQEIREVRSGKKKTSGIFDELEINPRNIRLYDEEMLK